MVKPVVDYSIPSRPKAPKLPTEYLLVTDRDSKILKSSENRFELVKLANTIRKAGGEVTIFKATKL